MIKGLELAGKNPTDAKFIADLRKVSNYNMGGLESPVNLTLSQFGKAPKKQCEYLVQFKGKSFVHPQYLCGKVLPNSDQLPSA
jgi:hypothetical protein